jgi:nucleoside-diphosphate kinase
MEKERTLVFIKPDGVDRNLTSEIFAELDQLGNRIKTAELKEIYPHIIEKHYKRAIEKHGEHLKRKLVFFKDKKIILALYEGKDIIKKIKDKVGATDPSKAEKGTIRHKWNDGESFDLAMQEDRFIRNLVHASENKEDFEREFDVWRSFLGE